MTKPWSPETEPELIDGIQRGTIRETHRMEVKAAPRNEAIALTIASLAIDGGTFIIGVEEITEEGQKRLSPKPFDLTGLPERVDAIARNSIDPPMAVHIREVPSGGEPGKGYLVIEVDPSPVAPHMANGSYYGRGETSRHKLSDSDVLRYHQIRRNQADLAEKLLDQEEARDYLTPGQSTRGHLYLIAEPLGRMPISTQPFLRDSEALWRIISDRTRSIPSIVSPYPWEAGHTRERNAGIAFVTSHANGPGRTPNAADHEQRTWEPKMLDIEVQANGGIRVYQSAATAPHEHDDNGVVLDAKIVSYTQHLVAWICDLEPHTHYNGHWVLGIRATRLRGLPSMHRVGRREGGPVGAMDTEKYSRTTVASTRDIQQRPRDVVATLVGDLLRVLGTAGEYHLKG